MMKFKRWLGIALVGAMLMTACGQQEEGSPASDGGGADSPAAIETTSPALADETVVKPVIDYPGSGKMPDFKGTGNARVSEKTLNSGEKEAVATGRKKAKDGMELDITPYIEAGKKYSIAMTMNFTIEESTVDVLACDCILTKKDGSKDVVVLAEDTVQSYRKTSLDEMIDTKGAKKVVLKWYMQECRTADIHIRSLKVTEVKTGTEAALKYTSAAELAKQYGFTIGTVMNGATYEEKDFQEIVKKHFNSLSTGNEMKAYSLLDQGESIQAAKKGNDEPQLSFALADDMVGFAAKNHIGIRGHCLVWDAYMCDWFFNEGYESDGKKVSREVMKKRLESYIRQVVEHFDKKFPGTVYCWDVVNEAVGDNPGTDCEENDIRRTRTKRDGEDNPFYKYVGEDYVKIAFQYARKYAAPSTKLFYNDYSTINPEKRAAIVELVKWLNSEEKLLDGVGMQAYLDMSESLLKSRLHSGGASLEDSVRAFSDLGVEIHLTEMTVRNYAKEKNEAHGDFYYQLFQKIKELNADKRRITNVTMWGFMDSPDAVEGDYTYNLSGTYYGIFDITYQPKPAFAKIVQALSEKQK